MRNKSPQLSAIRPIPTYSYGLQFAYTPTDAHAHTGADSLQIAFKNLLANITTTTWGSGGNTLTITSNEIKTGSVIIPWVAGSTPPNGRWAWAASKGQIVITSSDAESSTLSVSYLLIP